MRLTAKTRLVGQKQFNLIGGPQRLARAVPTPQSRIWGCFLALKARHGRSGKEQHNPISGPQRFARVVTALLSDGVLISSAQMPLGAINHV